MWAPRPGRRHPGTPGLPGGLTTNLRGRLALTPLHHQGRLGFEAKSNISLILLKQKKGKSFITAETNI